MTKVPIIDCLQYVNWSEKNFRQLRAGGVDAIHVTIVYHETFREMVLNIEQWNRWFQQYDDLIFMGYSADDVRRARDVGKTAVFFGFQNPSPIEDDLGLVEICYRLGIRFMQLTYNNQSLLAGGCFEGEDRGVTRFGRNVIAEMNRLGMVVDMSHSGDRSTLEAIEISTRPIAITHANPHWWHAAVRNKSDEVIRELVQAGGMLGFSLYPHHLKNGTQCSLSEFCEMVARMVDTYGVEHFGIGSDLCLDQPDAIVSWMRNGRWANLVEAEEKADASAKFPAQPDWFSGNADFPNLRQGLLDTGFSATDTDAILGGNWLRFYDTSFGVQADGSNDNSNER